jgi:sulfide dehydrogenase [flavocytochrome c] flavoprotein subunit
MSKLSRRNFIKLLGISGIAAGSGSLILPFNAQAKSGGSVVVVGGGFGGATCANYIRHFDSSVEVTLIEPSKEFITCPFSNTVLAGIYDMDYITHSYDGLEKNRGVKVIHDSVSAIDPAAKKVKLKGGSSVKYDRLVVSPGISFRWDAIEGASNAAAEIMPHAWKAGSQTLLLKKQLNAMKDGGTFIISVPQKPYRAPPAPYERASLVAYYLSEHKPKSKVLVIDSGDDNEELPLFQAAWKDMYPDMIEWVKGSEQGEIQKIDTKSMTVFGRSGAKHKGDVINLIPPQKAGDIALSSGLAGKDGWCDIDPATFESKVHKGIHVIGDACIAGEMPKTGHSAASQGKICAAAVVSALRGESLPKDFTYSESIYSLLKPRYGISSVGVYRLKNGKITRVSGGISDIDASRKTRRKESRFARGWYKGITKDTFAKS